MSLPSSRRFITQLLDALPPAHPHDAAANTPTQLPESAKKHLLALQVLFPNEFLPALDLLDRGLVVRLNTGGAGHSNNDVPDVTAPHPTSSAPRNYIYYVSSAQAPSRHASSYDTNTSYQVRLRAWNCSCPAFAFAAFPAAYDPADAVKAAGEDAWFGGVSLGEGVPPVCKHLLACVLVERGEGVFGGCVVEREVSVQEAVGWAAGWGD